MAVVDGGYSSGTWGQAGWGLSVYYPVASDAAVASETAASRAPVSTAIDEACFVNDAVSTILTLNASVSETIIASDVVQSGFTLSSSVADSAAVSEIVSSIFVPTATINESVSVAELTSSLANFISRITESTVASDAVTPLRTTFGTVLETATGAEQMSSTPAYKVVVDEATTANAIATSIFAIPNNIGEGVVAEDSANVFNTLLTSIVEAANVSLLVSSQADFVVSIEENVISSEEESSLAQTTVFVTSTAAASDTVSKRLLWEPIDTGVDEDWTLINTNL